MVTSLVTRFPIRIATVARIVSVLMLVSVWHGLAPSTVHAQRLDWKLEDFRPLTELPWDEAGKKPLNEVLTIIFREPDIQIRYPMLAAYLRRIPTEQLGAAFDQCIIMEGCQTPDGLVEFLLCLWAERDPAACWERTRGLFQLIGIEYGWLNYDSWTRRDRIKVRDAQAIQTSRFWLENESCLLGFPIGVEASSLPKEEKVKMHRAFADTWFTAFQSWPGGRPNPEYEYEPGGTAYYREKADELLRAFSSTPQSMRESGRTGTGPDYRASVEMGLRRWLKAEPKAALEILKKRDELLGEFPVDGGTPSPTEPSTEWLMIWRQVDLSAMTKWVDARELGKSLHQRAMLMSWVDERTRTRWLKVAEKDSRKDDLIGAWAEWNPAPALEAAFATKDVNIALEAANDAAYGPFRVWNTSHPGLGFIRDFDVCARCKSFVADIRDEIYHRDWGTVIMEQWGGIDAGEAARYGFDFMRKYDYVPRENLIKLFSGDDAFSSDADVLDRTFCAMRIWAVTKPDEMRAWIATINDAEMRTALTWLLENPWGANENAK